MTRAPFWRSRTIPFDPAAVNRVFFRIGGQTGQIIGATSVAVSRGP
jgi:hypothetical protein